MEKSYLNLYIKFKAHLLYFSWLLQMFFLDVRHLGRMAGLYLSVHIQTQISILSLCIAVDSQIENIPFWYMYILWVSLIIFLNISALKTVFNDADFVVFSHSSLLRMSFSFILILNIFCFFLNLHFCTYFVCECVCVRARTWVQVSVHTHTCLCAHVFTCSHLPVPTSSFLFFPLLLLSMLLAASCLSPNIHPSL